MVQKIINILALIGLAFCFHSSVIAEDGNKSSIRIIGRASVILTKKEVLLDDIAEISSGDINDTDAVIALQKIMIAGSPKPGEAAEVSGTDVLSRIQGAGVKLSDIIYNLPKTIKIERASREIPTELIREAVSKYLLGQSREVTLNDVKFNITPKIGTGIPHISVQAMGAGSKNGKISFLVTARTDAEDEVKFQVTALVDEWREVPVAKHEFRKGDVVNSDDVAMARLNTKMIPGDTVTDPEKVIGLETNRTVLEGEIFRRKFLAIPPVITTGSKVTMVYKSKFFEATASGVAIENAAHGDVVRVRNDSSKKIITGIAIEPGLVEVGS